MNRLREQAEKLFDRVRKSCTRNQSPIAIRPFTPQGSGRDEQTVFTVSARTVPGGLPPTLLPDGDGKTLYFKVSEL